MSLPEFVPFRKIPRLSREIIVTEKIDGTNAVIHVAEDGTVTAGSRTKWINQSGDNHGFAAWVENHALELTGLGVGVHHGEWWGSGIQRGYGLTKGEKRFSLFNTSKWGMDRPGCCHVVPVLYEGLFSTGAVDGCLDRLRRDGSVVAPGFMKPEGVIIFHPQGNVFFKKTIDKDDEWKGKTP